MKWYIDIVSHKIQNYQYDSIDYYKNPNRNTDSLQGYTWHHHHYQPNNKGNNR